MPLAVSNTLKQNLRAFEDPRSVLPKASFVRLFGSEPVTSAGPADTARLLNSELVFSRMPIAKRVNKVKNTESSGLTDRLEPDSLQLNTEASAIYWKGTKINGKHEGTVRLQEGYLVANEKAIVAGEFTADMNTISVTDIPEHEPVPRRRLRNHLKSEDFFYTEKYPTANFEIGETRKIKNDSLLILGLLSIRDVTKEIQLEAKRIESENGNPVFTTFFVIDRFEWNVAYRGSFWKRITSIFDNTFVNAEIELRVELHFHKS